MQLREQIGNNLCLDTGADEMRHRKRAMADEPKMAKARREGW